MKIRTIKYIVKEGGVNAYRNKIMSLASIGIVIATLLISGIFFLIAQIFAYSAENLMSQAQVKVFCDPELDDLQVAEVEKELYRNNEIRNIKKVSKKENFEGAKAMLGDNKDLLDGFDENFMMVSFEIELNNPSKAQDIVPEIRKIKGIKDVSAAYIFIEFYTNFTKWVYIFTALILVVMLTFTAFIISNTIKLTIFARRKEVNIMKYIGATDWFIRWPFIIEGIIIGIVGSVLAFLLMIWVHILFENGLGSSDMFKSLISVPPMMEIWKLVLGGFVIVGVSVGSMASVFSLRKHLKV